MYIGPTKTFVLNLMTNILQRAAALSVRPQRFAYHTSQNTRYISVNNTQQRQQQHNVRAQHAGTRQTSPRYTASSAGRGYQATGRGGLTTRGRTNIAPKVSADYLVHPKISSIVQF